MIYVDTRRNRRGLQLPVIGLWRVPDTHGDLEPPVTTGLQPAPQASSEPAGQHITMRSFHALNGRSGWFHHTLPAEASWLWPQDRDWPMASQMSPLTVIR